MMFDSHSHSHRDFQEKRIIQYDVMPLKAILILNRHRLLNKYQYSVNQPKVHPNVLLELVHLVMYMTLISSLLQQGFAGGSMLVHGFDPKLFGVIIAAGLFLYSMISSHISLTQLPIYFMATTDSS